MDKQSQCIQATLEPEVKFLLEKGLISKDILEAAQFEQDQSGAPLIRCLSSIGVLSREEIFTALSEYEDIPVINEVALLS
ncbi:MAG: hypothetical protein GY915_01005 [bacterium]|nr:hypothetical protein [bacterium]